ncbi:MAG: ATP-dependent DNA helicase RecG [Micrococcus sp.]|nr:ATP-dependent DNA helicase RecG [Micrococcus sp.]
MVGAKTAARLAQELDLHTVGELLDHVPRRYVERGELTPIAGLALDQEVTVVAEVLTASTRRMHRRSGFIVDVTVADRSVEGTAAATLSMAFFNGHEARRRLQPGVRAMFQGKTSDYRGALTLTNPDFTVLDDDAAADDADTRPVPLYRATSRLPSWAVRASVATMLEFVDLGAIDEVLTEELRSRAAAELDLTAPLPGTAEAYRRLHAPTDLTEVPEARLALALREALVVQASLAVRRARARTVAARPRPPRPDGLAAALDARLPYTLTPGQRSVGDQLRDDLASSTPMSRLLQGDVGAGKTLVALRAMAQVVDAGAQAALVAPTEVLAQQHWRSLRALLGPLAAAGTLEAAGLPATDVVLLTGSQKTRQRREALLKIVSGEAGIVVGTHALFSEAVHFAELGLAVVDEQHRFGVDQRQALREANPGTHLLVMSATPIPRSVAMTVFGDLDLTVLEGLPAGRQPVRTHVALMDQGPRIIARVWEVVAEQVRAGHQVFVVCPRIDDDEQDPAHAAVLSMRERVAALPGLQGRTVAAVHGRLEQSEQDAVMRAFAAGQIDVLVATTVIEVGVDVPTATLMVVLDAEDFGLSTLHQLRGRVGRGTDPATCLLVTRLPQGHPSVHRLRVLEETEDGMRIAHEDLRQRGVGDVLGAAQSGLRSTLAHLDVLRDAPAVRFAAETVEALLATSAELDPDTALAREVQRWERAQAEAADYVERG